MGEFVMETYDSDLEEETEEMKRNDEGIEQLTNLMLQLHSKGLFVICFLNKKQKINNNSH